MFPVQAKERLVVPPRERPAFADGTRRRLVFGGFDLLSLAVTWELTILLRIWLNPFTAHTFTVAELTSIAPPLFAILPLWLALALWIKLYEDCYRWSWGALLFQVPKAMLVATLLVTVEMMLFLDSPTSLSRSYIVLFTAVGWVVMSLCRCVAFTSVHAIEKHWPDSRRVAVVGADDGSSGALEELTTGGSLLSMEIVGVILPKGSQRTSTVGGMPVLGYTSALAEVINRMHLRQIIILPDNLPAAEIDECTRTSKRMGVVVGQIVGREESDARVEVVSRCGLRLLELKPVYFTRRQELAKRAFDILVASILLVGAIPVLIMAAICIRATSSGSVLYRSQRVGRGGRYFYFLKLRSMYSDAEARRQQLLALNEKGGHLFKIKNDPRVTPVGRFLRRYSLDEMPQLWNVMRGEMSLVGPRPLPAADMCPDGQSLEFRTWAEQRSRVLPGITGLWQVSGRSNLPFEQMVACDLEYIRNWSLWLDLKILLRTPRVVASGVGAH